MEEHVFEELPCFYVFYGFDYSFVDGGFPQRPSQHQHLRANRILDCIPILCVGVHVLVIGVYREPFYFL